MTKAVLYGRGKIALELWKKKNSWVAIVTIFSIASYFLFRFALQTDKQIYNLPLLIVLLTGGIPLLYELVRKLLRREFGSDFLAGISIVASVFLKEYLAGAIVVLMLSGGKSLEDFALQNASSVLTALAKRMPSVAHRRQVNEVIEIGVSDIAVGNTLMIFPHELCPVDGIVV